MNLTSRHSSQPAKFVAASLFVLSAGVCLADPPVAKTVPSPSPVIIKHSDMVVVTGADTLAPDAAQGIDDIIAGIKAKNADVKVIAVGEGEDVDAVVDATIQEKIKAEHGDDPNVKAIVVRSSGNVSLEQSLREAGATPEMIEQALKVTPSAPAK